MKKILLTNNSQIVNLVDSEYDQIYTDSPYVKEKFDSAIYLETLLDKNFEKSISDIRKKGYEINKKIIDIFFPNYKSRNINILDIQLDFTNIFINIVKLLKLIDLHPNDEITIGVTDDELYDNKSPNALDRFVNVYYWISDLVKLKNVNLINIYNKRNDLNEDHLPINNWFLRLVDLDKKVLLYNFLKKIKLINRNKEKKIYIYKKSPVLREIEAYLYNLGFNIIDMPEINFQFNSNDNDTRNGKIRDLLDSFFENNYLNNAYKAALLVMYKKRIEYYFQKEKYTKGYISKLDNSINVIITSTINGFDSHIFAKQLQQSDFKIINVMHGLSTSFRRKKDLDFFECQAPDMTLCFNSSERDMFNELVPRALIHPISVVQEAKKKRFRFLKRLCVNKLLKINENVNIFYPSIHYPYNNLTNYGFRNSDRFNYQFEKKMISISSSLNKRMIYKNYPKRCFIDTNPLIKYAKSFKNIKVIDGSFDFRFVSSIGDIYILGGVGASSTLTWMLGENKPIIYLHSNKFQFINDEGKKILDKIFIVVNIDEDNWHENLIEILNKPYKDLVQIWKNKEIYRDQFDEKWLMGNHLHGGKLGAKYIEDMYIKTNKVMIN
ncbi:hypothetical protein [Candidatus Pelagibacter bacterium nBUS_28]|uniref:hypothetical protein n=1 Tax=Candidatus Pelagibacter bacterium nBUS_28 TaxID=3374189 RepID=UPI003EC08C05